MLVVGADALRRELEVYGRMREELLRKYQGKAVAIKRVASMAKLKEIPPIHTGHIGY